MDFCVSVHGGSVDDTQPTLDGMWVTLVNVATPAALIHYMTNSQKLMKKVVPKVVMYIKIDQQLGEKSTFIHFGSEPYHFRVAIGAPFGKDDEATAWLISFLNVGDQIASERECFLLAGANCSESHILMITYCQKLMAEIGNIENQICDGGENFQVKFTFDLVPSDMKWASFFSGELPNSAFYFSPFGNVNDDDKNTVNGSLGTDSDCTWQPWNYNER